LEEVREALSGGANVNCVDFDRYTPLLVACRRDDDWSAAEAIVSELLSAGAVMDACTKSMEMAIPLAAHCGRADVA
jgi:ankyrin repeat protein